MNDKQLRWLQTALLVLATTVFFWVIVSACTPDSSVVFVSDPETLTHEKRVIEGVIYDCFYIWNRAAGLAMDCEVRP